MILVDTSAWIEFDRATGSEVDRRLATLFATDGPIAVTEPIVMEVLAGAKTVERHDSLRRLLHGVSQLRFESPGDFESASAAYRRCRSVGVTPPGMLDCMIVSVAWRNGASILTCDRDIVRIAETLEVKIDPASISVS